jgi:hypothetical protein
LSAPPATRLRQEDLVFKARLDPAQKKFTCNIIVMWHIPIILAGQLKLKDFEASLGLQSASLSQNKINKSQKCKYRYKKPISEPT